MIIKSLIWEMQHTFSLWNLRGGYKRHLNIMTDLSNKFFFFFYNSYDGPFERALRCVFFSGRKGDVTVFRPIMEHTIEKDMETYAKMHSVNRIVRE
jgi:hypothetical protein